MSVRREAIDVRVSQRILWFGSEAYPLHNITRTNTLKREPNRGAAIRRFVISSLLWLFGAGLMTGVAPGVVGILAFVGVLALIAVKAVRLVDYLNLTLYELLIETAAGSHRGLVTNNSNVVSDLAIRITDAINNPAVEFQMRVENFQIGDNINMYGNQNTGKVAG